MDLEQHETNSQHRYEKLMHHVKKGNEMSERVNFFEGGGMGAGAAGFGGAGLGVGALLGLALGRGGLFGGGFDGRGNWGGDGCVTPMQLQTATGSIIDAGQNNQIMGMLQGIATSVPVAEGQIQLALSQSQGQMMNQIGQQSLAIAQGFAGQAQNTAQAQAAIIAVGESVKDAVNANGSANLLATQSASAQNLAAIASSTNLILTALKDTEITNLNRQLTVSELRNTEDRAEARARATEVNVTQTVNQNQMQLQAQQQQQQQAILLNQLCAHFATLQNAVATNSNLIVGNTGAVATGPQTANPVNVRA